MSLTQVRQVLVPAAGSAAGTARWRTTLSTLSGLAGVRCTDGTAQRTPRRTTVRSEEGARGQATAGVSEVGITTTQPTPP